MWAWNEETGVYDAVFHVVYAITSASGLLLNVFLLYCAIYRSPHNLKEYRIFIVKSVITDLILIFSVAFVEPRMITTGSMYAYIVIGPAYYFGHNVAFVFYGFVLNMFFYTVLSFPLPFAYRYYVIVKPCDRRKQILNACIGLYAIAFLQLIAFFFTQTDVTYVRQFLQDHLSEIDLTGKVVYGSDTSLNPLTIVMVITCVATSVPVYVMVFYYRWKVNTVLRCKIADLSQATILTHKKLMQAVTIQATLPAFFVFPPICIYLLQHANILNILISEYLVFAMVSCLPTADALVTIYCIKPYYMVVRRMLHMRISRTLLDGFTVGDKTNKTRRVEPSSSQNKLFVIRTK